MIEHRLPASRLRVCALRNRGDARAHSRRASKRKKFQATCTPSRRLSLISTSFHDISSFLRCSVPVQYPLFPRTKVKITSTPARNCSKSLWNLFRVYLPYKHVPSTLSRNFHISRIKLIILLDNYEFKWAVNLIELSRTINLTFPLIVQDAEDLNARI